MDNRYKLLFDFLKIKSVSTNDKYLPEMKKAKKFLVSEFEKLGFETKTLKGHRHDAIYAQFLVDPSLPTVLIYGHYDVQPPEPLNEWVSNPFDPEIRDGNIYARGATDDKGQLLVHIEAVNMLLNDVKKPNINIKFFVEGEEEIGSVSISDIVLKHKKLFECDYLIVSDSEMPKKGFPAIDISLRGIVYTQVDLEVGKNDIHSGQFGGVSPNPANILANIITSLKSVDGHINIPGYYDDVVEPTKDELKLFNKVGTTEADILHEGNLYSLGGGENTYSINERRWSRPTLDVNGIWGGYQEPGQKTIIPSKAGAKISMRLVSNQDPDKIFTSYEKFVKSLVPKGVKCKITNFTAGEAYKAPTDNKIFDVMKKALKHGFGKEVVYTGVGGSIGFVPIMAKAVDVPVLMVGWGLPTDLLHAPNEHFDLDNYDSGIKTMIEFYRLLTEK